MTDQPRGDSRAACAPPLSTWPAVLYGRRPIVSQMAARTSSPSSTFSRATSVATTASSADGGGFVAFPALRGLTDRVRGLDAFRSGCRSAGVMSAMSDGRSRRPSARTRDARGLSVAAARAGLDDGEIIGRRRAAVLGLENGEPRRRWICAADRKTPQAAEHAKDTQRKAFGLRSQRIAAVSNVWASRTQVARRRRVLEHLRGRDRAGTRSSTSVMSPDVVADRVEPRHDEPGVRRQLQPIDARDHFVAQRGIEMHAVGVDERARRLVIALALDALDLGEQAADAFAERLRRRSSRSRSCRRASARSIAVVCAISQRTIIWRLRMWSSSICVPSRTRRSWTSALRV